MTCHNEMREHSENDVGRLGGAQQSTDKATTAAAHSLAGLRRAGLRRAGLAGVTLLFLGACGSTADFDLYRESITSFKTATDQTSLAVAFHILTVRDVDRARMFAQLEQVDDPCTLSWVARRKQPGVSYAPEDCAFLAIETVRAGRFTREAVAVRHQVFDMLNEYTTLLSEVAESDAPARWDSAAKGLGASTAGLLTTVEAADRDGTLKPLAPLKGLLGEEGPLTKLVSFAGQQWINYRRAKALDSIITTGKPAIDEISRLLREDFAFVRKRETFEADEVLADIVFTYAEATAEALADPRKRTSRNATLAAVEQAIIVNETQLAEIQSIGMTMDAFDDAHAALVDYAQSSKTPQDVGALVAVVKRYAAAAKEIYEAYKASAAAAAPQ